MKVLKIDIKKQEVDVPDNVDSFEEILFSPVHPIILDDGTALPSGQQYKIRYKLATLLPKAGDEIRYAVKINDMNLFVDLLTVSAKQYIAVEEHEKILREDQETRFKKYQEAVATETKDALQKLAVKVQADALERFCNLAWWRRLFKQF
jgi:hypothetical protein